MPLSIGFSPCPNDTYVFDALVHGRVSPPEPFTAPRLEDVETLNRMARRGELDVAKVSYGALPYLLDDYALLRSGGALGRGCGPLLVARTPFTREELHGRAIAIPGRFTTANLLLRLFAPELEPGREMSYADIMPAVARGEVDAGLIIHESRFTYSHHGLVRVVDLGEWWEAATGAPLPLGGIVARRSLGADRIGAIEAAIRASVAFALGHPAASVDYVRANAREMAPDVIRQHIDLYVNDFSLELGPEGERAVRSFLSRAASVGLVPESPEPFAVATTRDRAGRAPSAP